MPWVRLTCLALLGCVHQASKTGDAGVTTVSSAAVVAAAPSASVTADVMPDPAADYTSIDDAKLDGNKAVGKTLLLRVWRGTTEADKVTLYSCTKASSAYVDTRYALEMRPLVKRIPPSLPVQSRCPRALIQVTGKQPFLGELRGQLAQVLDVTPAQPEPLPPGVDYVSMDDINIDGKKAAGKVAQLRGYRGTLDDKKFILYPCGRAGGLNFMNVMVGPDQRDSVQGFSDSMSSCQTIRVKLTNQAPFNSTWTAQLIEIPKE